MCFGRNVETAFIGCYIIAFYVFIFQCKQAVLEDMAKKQEVQGL